ncbi:hypothetical protein DB347_04110 [Opitutaceae bacterium EW11]|nr:hypothetical protein DB347_04110 [Opitutaceae bacterium EW11]
MNSLHHQYPQLSRFVRGAAIRQTGRPTRSLPGSPRARFFSLPVLAVVGATLCCPTVRGGPDQAEVLAWLNSTQAGRVSFSRIEMESLTNSEGVSTLHFQAMGHATETLYSKMNTSYYFEHGLNLDVDKLTASRAYLEGEDGKTLLQRLGATEPLDLRAITVLRQSTPAGSAFAYAGQATARRENGAWVFADLGSGFVFAAPSGDRLRSFEGRVFVAGRSRDDQTLRRLAAEQVEFTERLVAARAELAEERRLDQNTELTAFLSPLKPGTFFVGQVFPDNGGQPGAVILEIVSLNRGARKLVARFRNDGGWLDTRSVVGTWPEKPSSDSLAIQLQSTEPNDWIVHGGPILGYTGALEFNGQIAADGTFTAAGCKLRIQMMPMSESGLAKFRAICVAYRQKLLTPTQPGIVYRGEARARTGSDSCPIQIRFTEQDPGRMSVAAILESPTGAAFSRALRGNLIENSHRAENRPIRLTLFPIDSVRSAPANSIFAYARDLAMELSVEGDTLSGKDENFVYRLTRVSPEPRPVPESAIPDTPPTIVALPPGAKEPPFPRRPGLYALVEGKWLPLPRNQARKVEYEETKPADVASGKPMVEVVFTGTDPRPVLPRDSVRLAYRGAPPAQPEGVPDNFPVAEASRSFLTVDGIRHAPLDAILSDVYGFAPINTVPLLSEWKEKDLLVIHTRDLVPSTYAVAIGSECYEYEVK